MHSEEVGGGTTISGASVFNQCLCRSNARRESLGCFMKTRTGSQRQKPGGYVIKAVLKNFLSPITFFFFSQTSQLVIFFTDFTLLDVSDEKLTLATRITRCTCLEDGRILVSLSVIQSR